MTTNHLPQAPTPSAATTDNLPAAVLWDMDGTLIDTEPYWGEAEQAIVSEAGGVWTQEQAHSLVGSALLESARVILEATPVTGTPEQVVERLLSHVIARTTQHLPWRPGARELLTELTDAGVPCALVTMSWTSLADVLIDALPEGTFSAVVTGDVVTHGKPHPEPYLTAARALRVDPADCLAIEDSQPGAQSAVAAGVPTLGVPNLVDLEQVPGLTIRRSLEGLRLADLAEVQRQSTSG